MYVPRETPLLPQQDAHVCTSVLLCGLEVQLCLYLCPRSRNQDAWTQRDLVMVGYRVPLVPVEAPAGHPLATVVLSAPLASPWMPWRDHYPCLSWSPLLGVIAARFRGSLSWAQTCHFAAHCSLRCLLWVYLCLGFAIIFREKLCITFPKFQEGEEPPPHVLVFRPHIKDVFLSAAWEGGN